MPTLVKEVKIVGIFIKLNRAITVSSTVWLHKFKIGSNRKLVGDEEVLVWVFVLVRVWEGFFIPVSRE